MTPIIRLLALGMVTACAAGCTTPMTNGEEQSLAPTDRYPITVEPQVVTMAVAVDGGLQRLAPGESERVRAFAESWKARGQGMINAATPDGVADHGASMAALDEVRHILHASGVQPRAVNVTSYRAGDDRRAPITLSFVTLAASTAECGVDWSENLAWSPRNMPWPDFGCSSQHNFAALVADPRDIVEPRTQDPADNQRRAKVLDNHRLGVLTQSQHNSDDSGTVSSVQAQ